jgi:UMF1 family MFS transporter
MHGPGAGALAGRRRGIVGWCLYDWAMSAFNTVIGTFVFSRYFTEAVAADPNTGTQQWGLALGISGILVAILSPILGAIGDQGGRVKPWLGTLTAICVAATAVLFFVKPEAQFVMLALLAMAVAATAFELSYVFYNALLPTAAPASHTGRVSGWGWGVGYFGGLGSLIVCLLLLVQTETPFFGLLGKEEAENIRATALLVAIWYAVFAIPLFLLTPDRPSTAKPLGAVVRICAI